MRRQVFQGEVRKRGECQIPQGFVSSVDFYSHLMWHMIERAAGVSAESGQKTPAVIQLRDGIGLD